MCFETWCVNSTTQPAGLLKTLNLPTGSWRAQTLSRWSSWWCRRAPIHFWHALPDSGWSGLSLSCFAAFAASPSASSSAGVKRGWGNSACGRWRWSLWTAPVEDTLLESPLNSALHFKWCLHSCLLHTLSLKQTGPSLKVGCLNKLSHPVHFCLQSAVWRIF